MMKPCTTYLASPGAITEPLQFGAISVPSGTLMAPGTVQQAEARQVVDAFLPGLVFGIDAMVAREHYAELRTRLFNLFAPKDRRGRAKSNFVGEWTDPTTQKMLGVQENDVWIAAFAMAYNLTLVSSDKMNNIRHAAGSDLSFEDWGALSR